MNQNTVSKTNKSNSKKNDSVAIRFEKSFMKRLGKLVDKANKKQFGRKVQPKNILISLFELADQSHLDSAVEKAQKESLRHKDEKDMFIKEFAAKLGGNVEAIEKEMMELFKQKYIQI